MLKYMLAAIIAFCAALYFTPAQAGISIDVNSNDIRWQISNDHISIGNHRGDWYDDDDDDDDD